MAEKSHWVEERLPSSLCPKNSFTKAAEQNGSSRKAKEGNSAMTQKKTHHRSGTILGAVIFAFIAAALFHWQSRFQAFVPFVEHYHGGTTPASLPPDFSSTFTRSQERCAWQLTQHVGAGDELEGAIFIGHLATDLDSIVAAIAAAELHRSPHKHEQNQPGIAHIQRVGGSTHRAAFHARLSNVEGGSLAPWRCLTVAPQGHGCGRVAD